MIAAAGSGQRLGAGGPKAFVELAGKPLLAWSLLAVSAAAEIETVVIAAPAGRRHRERALAAAAAAGVEAEVIDGGASRAESVLAGVEAAQGELVVAHDAARPLVEPSSFDRLLALLDGDPAADAAIVAAPMTDTVKLTRPEAGGGEARPPGGAGVLGAPGEAATGRAPVIERTIARESLWAAQTPQAFRRDRLLAAQRDAREAGLLVGATDEAALIEAAGGTVLIDPAPAHNLKVTVAEDLLLVEALLAARRRV